jgi:hypothetical protein
MPLQAVLQKVFEGTEYRFSFWEGQLFITKTYAIQTSLPKQFFTGKPIEDTVPAKRGNFVNTGNQPAEITDNNTVEYKLVEIGRRTNNTTGKATITGYVKGGKNGEPISGAVVSAGGERAVSDQFGFYKIVLSKGRHLLTITSLGMRDSKRQIALNDNGNLNIELQEYVTTLKAVEVAANQRTSNVKSLQMGVERINMKVIKQVPVVFGEADVLRTVLTLPGVTSVGEASTGFNVRGGSADQNLVLFNDATIYNPSHFFGFFSAFNPDVVKGIELYKSSIPEKFGGRLSSVLDVSIQEGNKKKFGGAGGIGPLTSHLMFEGPIAKEKGSFIIGGRTTYSDWLLKKIPDENYKNSKASFYDLSVHIAHQLDAKNFIYVTGYFSQDHFRLNLDTTYEYRNKNVNVKWKHIFKNNLYGVFTAGYDAYDYSINSTLKPLDAYKLKFGIEQFYAKADFTISRGNKHRFNFGLNSLLYRLTPGTLTPNDSKSLVVPDIVQQEKALENALYFGDRIELTSKLSVEAGLRYSFFTALGSRSVYDYAPGLPREETTIIDTLRYGNNKAIKTYHGPEIRISSRYTISDDLSVKLSFNTLRQYIHMLSNTTAISPVDIWKLSDRNIKPQTGEQLSLGLYKNFNSKGIEASVEVYYKRMRNYLDYKSGAQLILNHHIETDVLSSRGKAYGVELMVKKMRGKLNGWISYTYSRTMLQTNDPLADQPVNGGNYYPANFDKPHSVNVISNYKFSHRFSISLNAVYSTGRPITLPIALYSYGGADRVYYSDRNQYRIPDNFRVDFSMNIEGSHKIKKLAHSSWTLGVYNVTARKNPYSVYFITQANAIKGYKLSIFGTAIPFITYNFRF